MSWGLFCEKDDLSELLLGSSGGTRSCFSFYIESSFCERWLQHLCSGCTADHSALCCIFLPYCVCAQPALDRIALVSGLCGFWHNIFFYFRNVEPVKVTIGQGSFCRWWLMPSGSVGTSRFSHAACPSRRIDGLPVLTPPAW